MMYRYDQRMKKWLRFGGDPLEPLRKCDGGTNSPNEARLLHPLSPFGIVDAKPLYVGHPCYSLVFFGGTHYQTGAPSSRVVAYSFLSGRWERWPDMMRARHGGKCSALVLLEITVVGVVSAESAQHASSF